MMTKDGKARYRLAVLFFAGMLAAATELLSVSGSAQTASQPAPLTPEEQREKLVIERFVGVLEKNPRRGTALDRIYGYHVERGSLDKFIETYTTRTKKDAKDGVAWMIVGLVESQRGRDANAVAAFRQAETQQPDNPITSYYLGQSLVLVGQPDAAAEAFERALTRKPNRTDLLDIFQALGRVYQRAQRTEKALGVWNRLEKLFPDDQRVQEQIASTLAEEGQFEQALPRYEKLAKASKDPYKQAAFRMEAAELKVRLKQTTKALADFEDLLGQLNPESWLYREVRRKVEEVFLRNDDQAGLAKYYESWLAKNASDVEAMTRLARTLATQGRLPESRSWLEKALQKAPTRRDIRHALVDQLVFEQKYAEAAGQFEAMDKNEPNNPDTLREWGKLLLRDTTRPEAERKQAAVAVWKRLLDRKPKDPVTTAQVADLIRTAGLTDEAIALYQKAIELAPKEPQYREYLGEYYHVLKRPAEALAAWRPIAAGENRNAKNLARLAEVLASFSYRKEAIVTLADAVSLEKDDINLFLKYAGLLHLDGRNNDALKQLDAATKLVSNAEEAESILVEQIKIFQATETLGARIQALKKELDAGKEPTVERWMRLARYHEADRNLAEATEAILKALAKDSKSIPVLAAAARIHEGGGNLLAAAETNRKLAAIDRRFRTEYLTNVAKLEARLGRRAEALQAGRDLLAAAPGNPEHYKFYAELCFQLGDSEEGLESLRRSVRANPSEPSGLQTLGNALAERFRTGEAIELFWRAFDKTNDLDGKLGIISRLTELYIQNNQFDRFMERLERERRESDKQREMTICMAHALQAAGDLGTARQQLERLLSENARDTQLLSQLSNLAESEGDITLALKYQRQFEKAAPSNRDAKLRLAQLLVRSGDVDEAANIWMDLVAGEPEPHRNLQAIDGLLSHGKHEAAVAVTKRLLTLKPGNWELLYREGAALAAQNKREEAERRFQAILDARLDDDELGDEAKYQKKQKKSRSPGTTQAGLAYDPNRFPLQQRLDNVWQLRAYTGLDPRYGYWASQQQQTWAPSHYGQARMAALGWLMGFAQKDNQLDAWLKQRKQARDKAAADLRVQWDWYYLQTLRQDQREMFDAARALAKFPDPACQWVFLHSLNGRTAIPGRPMYYRPADNPKVDKTPPLPAEQVDLVLSAYNRLRKQKPEWLTTLVVNNVLTEIKRAKRTAEENRIYKEAVDSASTIESVNEVLEVAATRGDLDGALKLFAKLEQLQGPGSQVGPGMMPTRQAAQSLGRVMKALADAKKHTDLPRLFEAYQASQRKQRRIAANRSSLGSGNQPPGGSAYYLTYVGQYTRYMPLDFPQANDYYDQGSIQLLRTAYEFYKRDDLLSDLFAYIRKRLAEVPAPEKLDYQLALGYMHWWSNEKEQALVELTAASDLVPSDVGMKLDLAQLRERNNEFQEALAILDAITPLDHTTMQKRETAALRLAVRAGKVDRARQAADRLFGLRLDAETQVQLAGQMHQLGMHEAAETVIGRAQRQAGNRTAALVNLMNQYMGQNKADMAVAVARQLLRKGPSMQFRPYYYYGEQSDGRTEAIQILARSGKLNEMIERAEAQLKSSPKSAQLHQTLIDYYKAAGNKEKLKTTAQAMAKLKPDDGKMHYQLGMQMMEIGEPVAATEHFKEAVLKEPSMYYYYDWQINQAYMQANKYDDLLKLFEQIDLKTVGGNFYAVTEMIQMLLQKEKNRPAGLKLFRKAWETFPSQRVDLMRSLYQEEIWRLPEIYDYARQAFIPNPDAPVDPWRGADEVIYWGGNDGRVTGLATRLLEVARRQNRVDALTRDVEQALAKVPQWSAGKGLLVLLDLQRGRTAAARKAWIELLEDERNRMPLMARYILVQEMEGYGAVEDLVLRTYESTVEEAANDMNMDFSYSPIRRLITLYKQADRKAEARGLMLKFTKPNDYDYWNAGYSAYRRIYTTSNISDQLVELGYPVDAVRLCNELLTDRETLETASQWQGDRMTQMAEQSLNRSLKSLKPEKLPDSVRDLLKPRQGRKPTEAVLDLILLVPSRDLQKAELSSVFEAALRSTAKTPELRKEMLARLDELVKQHPKDLSVQIAAALGAAVEDKPERIAAAAERLVKLVETTPLEELPLGVRANSRQRGAAFPQMALWLVARECLKRTALRSTGEKLGKRALEAARRQLDTVHALAVLREWGQIEMNRGDRKAAEERWAQMLDLALPKPVAPAAAAQTPTATPAGATTPATPASVGEPQASSRAPPAGASPARIEDSQRDGNTYLVALLAPEFDEKTAAPAPAKPSAATATPAKPAAPSKSVPAVTIQQFEQAIQVASLALDKDMPALSLQAIREALRGGPPVQGQGFDPRYGRAYAQPTGLPQQNAETSNPYVQQVESHVQQFVAEWQRRRVPVAEIYDTLAAVVFAEARSAEVFLYPQSLAPETQQPRSLGRLLVNVAAQAGRLDDVRKRAEARQAQPLGELQARVLLALVSLAADDKARAIDLLKWFDQRLQKDTLQNTAELACHAALPALAKPDLAAAALPILEHAAKNLNNANADHVGGPVVLVLARYHFERKNVAAGKQKLKEYLDRVASAALRRGGDSYRIQQALRVAQEYARAGLFTDCFPLLAQIADLPASQRSFIQQDALAAVTAAVGRQFASRPAKERHDLLKTWTLPEANRKAVRLLAAFVPVEAPPPSLGQFPAPADGVFSTAGLLIEAARELGKLDELANEARKLSEAKVENAAVLYQLVQLARDQGPSVEEPVRKRLAELKKKADEPVDNSPRRYYYYGGDRSQSTFETTDYLLARACLADSKMTEVGETLAQVLQTLAQPAGNMGYPGMWYPGYPVSTPFAAHLRHDVAMSQVARHGARPDSSSRFPDLLHWHTAAHDSLMTRQNGPLLPWWVAQEGHVAHVVGPEQQYLIYDYPLVGSFEFSVEVHQGGGEISYGGQVFDVNSGQIAPVGRHEQIYRPFLGLRTDAFNRLTVQVEPGKVRCLVNGRLFYETTEPSPTSPWIALLGSRERHTVFRNFTLRGMPQVPREVRLVQADRLEGWISGFYSDTQFNRLSSKEMPEQQEGYRGVRSPGQEFDWQAKDGEINGRRTQDFLARDPVSSRLAYFRPLRSGETLRYEFYYRPGETMVHPSLGRLAFLLEPEGVRLHWMTDDGGTDWTGLAADNAFDEPANRRGDKPLSLKPDAWNTLQMSVTEDGVTLQLNGAPIYERKLEATVQRIFGLFHYKDRTAVRVRNVVLTGNWPEKPPIENLVQPGATDKAAAQGAARRALIGEDYLLLSARRVLEQARTLPAEQCYEALAVWVLPNNEHAVFQLSGDFRPGMNGATSSEHTSSGARLQTGGELDAPALELVRVAKKIGKLEELASRVRMSVPSDDPVRTRGRLAMLAVVLAAQERDTEAAEALKQLAPLLAKLPEQAQPWQRWPELIAAAGTMARPALREAALALLDTMVKQTEIDPAKPAPPAARADWLRRVRHLRARAHVLGLPAERRLEFGADPRLRYWAPVSHARAATRGGANPPAHWAIAGAEVRHYPGHAHDHLYFCVPLRGEFEVRGELTTATGREAHLSYGGLRLDLKPDLKAYELHSFGRRLQTGTLEPPLARKDDWHSFRLVVGRESWTVFVGDRKVFEEPLPANAEPWLMLHADHQASAAFRGLTISGKPTVPEHVDLTALPDLTGWLSYFDEPNPGFGDGGSWYRRGEEIKASGGKPENPPDRPPQPRTYQERALHYHRPLLEDAAIEYEFYYEPDKFHVHPLMDRLTFLLEPEGVKVHWLTDGPYEKTNLTPDNITTEANNRRGPAKLPLKAKAWNRMKMALTGDRVTVHLNDVEIYQRTLEATNQRTFGLFHYVDESEARVRKVTYRGQWAKQLPDAANLFATAKDAGNQ